MVSPRDTGIWKFMSSRHHVANIFGQNGCLYYIHGKRNGVLNSYAMRNPFGMVESFTPDITSRPSNVLINFTPLGVGSGGEQFKDRLVKACAAVWKREKKKVLDPDSILQIREQMKDRIARWGPGKTQGPQKFRFVDEGDEAGIIILPEEKINECWSGAYQPALDRVAGILLELKRDWKDKKYENKPSVVASGGSLMNEALNERVEAMVKDAGLGPVLKVTRHGVSYESVFPNPLNVTVMYIANHSITASSLRLIVGIMHSVARAITVRQFLRQGAGIGLQMKQARATIWDDRAECFWYHVSL